MIAGPHKAVNAVGLACGRRQRRRWSRWCREHKEHAVRQQRRHSVCIRIRAQSWPYKNKGCREQRRVECTGEGLCTEVPFYCTSCKHCKPVHIRSAARSAMVQHPFTSPPNNFKFCTVNANQQPLVLHDTLASSTHDFLGGDCAHSTRYYSLAHENVSLGSNQPFSRFWQRGLFPSTKQGSFSLFLTLCSAPCSAPGLSF